jgi:hypothetical protein
MIIAFRMIFTTPGWRSRVAWDEHLRQHDRLTRRDWERPDRIRAMTDPGHPTAVTHRLTPRASA